MSKSIVKQEKIYRLYELFNYYELCNRAKSRQVTDSIKRIDTKLLREYVL